MRRSLRVAASSWATSAVATVRSSSSSSVAAAATPVAVVDVAGFASHSEVKEEPMAETRKRKRGQKSETVMHADSSSSLHSCIKTEYTSPLKPIKAEQYPNPVKFETHPLKSEPLLGDIEDMVGSPTKRPVKQEEETKDEAIKYDYIKEEEEGIKLDTKPEFVKQEQPDTENQRQPTRQPPPNWEEIYKAIHDYRKQNHAPVDTMGCGWLASKNQDPKNFRFQTLVGILISSQTKDPVTAAAFNRLSRQLPAGLTPQSILAVDGKTLEAILRGVSFHVRKTLYLKQTAATCIAKYDGDIPHTLEGLLELPGVGPKVGHLALQCAWGIVAGIGVDTHVHRICNRLGWVKSKESDPEQTRKQLEEWLPKSHWSDINPMLVGLGQTVCTAISPSCQACPATSLCPKIGTRKRK